MDIFSYLQDMQTDIKGISDTKIFEKKYYDICLRLASESDANRIKGIKTDKYLIQLEKCLSKAFKKAYNNDAAAIYFEYDLENDWNSNFYICDEYNKLVEENDDWACEYSSEIEGPEFYEFSEIYNENGFDKTEKAMGITLYLIAKTVAKFKEACEYIESDIPICIAYHDQDPIFRVIE